MPNNKTHTLSASNAGFLHLFLPLERAWAVRLTIRYEILGWQIHLAKKEYITLAGNKQILRSNCSFNCSQGGWDGRAFRVGGGRYLKCWIIFVVYFVCLLYFMCVFHVFPKAACYFYISMDMWNYCLALLVIHQFVTLSCIFMFKNQ